MIFMIDKKELQAFVENELQDSDLFLVDLTIDKDNNIVIEVDSVNSVSVDDCTALNRSIEDHFAGEMDDYQLEVGSAGLTSPFKVKAQYDKNIGNEVEVLTKTGEKLKGVLSSAADDGFVVVVSKKVKPEGAKRPVLVEEPKPLKYDEIKYTKYLIQFK